MTSCARLAILLVCMAAVGRADEPSPATDGGAASPWSKIEPAVEPAAGEQSTSQPSGGAREDRKLRRGTAPSRSAGVTSSEDGGGWLRSIVSLGAVVGVILFLAWGYRATTAGASMRMRARRPGLIQVVSRTNLSPRQSFCLVRVGPRMVLVGVSGEGLRTLDVIDDADLVSRLSGEAETEKSSPAFKAALEQDLSRYENETAPMATPASNTRMRISQVLSTLARAKT